MAPQDTLYTVTQLGSELGITARTLRFYEDKGLITPRRAGNTRVYTQRDRARMILILRGKQLGFSLREIKEYLELYDLDPTHAKQTKALLKAVQSRIGKLENQRVVLDETLAELRNVQLQAEAALRVLENAPQLQSVKKEKTVTKSARAGSAARAVK
jgi:DNA-binding transcriptional MerR regulator